jgi:spoIIIJ-associated protein
MSEQAWTVEEVGPKIDGFLEPVLEASGLDLEYEVTEGGGDERFIIPDVTVSFDGEDLDLLLAHKGELLLALEQLTLEALHVSHADRYRLIFDARDYRLMRIEELRLSAEAAAEQVKRTGMAYHFNPMSSRERRILHLALRDDPEVDTISEGIVPRRHTVIRKAEPDRRRN